MPCKPMLSTSTSFFKILASVVVPMQSICVGTTIILWACFWLIRYKVPYPSVPYRYCMHPSRYRINSGTVPIPNFSDNYLGDNYLNCIYNYRYRNLSKLLFLHPSCNGSPPFFLLNLQRGRIACAAHDSTVCESQQVNFAQCSVQNWLFWPVRHSLHALHPSACPMRQSTMLESFLQYYLSIVSCEIWIDWHFLLYKGQRRLCK